MDNRFAFIGGAAGKWRILSIAAVSGEPLASAANLDIVPLAAASTSGATWTLAGQISNLRYATRAEVTSLVAKQQGLGRPEARRAALIPIKKTPAWWALAQDERRAIFEEQSHHTEIGLNYLPAVARQLYHSRDLGQPFDFLTWFEYAHEHADAFEALVRELRRSREWQFVEREVDIRLERAV